LLRDPARLNRSFIISGTRNRCFFQMPKAEKQDQSSNGPLAKNSHSNRMQPLDIEEEEALTIQGREQ
jgi:hypothetical protein